MTISGAIDSGVNGLIAFSNQVASISENLANTSTPGFKRVDTTFQDMVNGGEKTFSEPNSVVSIYSPDTVRSMPIYRVNVAGTITTNGNPTSFAVTQGSGFIPVTETKFSNGVESLGTDARYTGAGDFSADANNYLVNSQGQALMAVPETSTFSNTFPAAPSASDVKPVNLDPTVYASMPGTPTTSMSVNANFPGSVPEQDVPPWSITTAGNTVTGGTGPAAGSPTYSWVGANGGNGTIEPDAVEGSNVDVATELTQMIQAQQAYGSNSKVVTVGDQMLQTLIGLKS